MLRAIHIFPKFVNVHSIHLLRAKYDPLVKLIPPHITLVFPFESDINSEPLAHHVKEVTAELKPFRMALTGGSIGVISTPIDPKIVRTKNCVRSRY